MKEPITFTLGEGCIKTHVGKTVNLLNTDTASIDVDDIAIALARKCRYNGHTSQFYSVAAHSIVVGLAMPRHLEIYGLLHDAAEAYLPDIASPIKPYINGFDLIEAQVMGAVYRSFGVDNLDTLVDGAREWVKKADNAALMVEADAFMGENFIERGWEMPGIDIAGMVHCVQALKDLSIAEIAKLFKSNVAHMLELRQVKSA